jgi:hypothetical protein
MNPAKLDTVTAARDNPALQSVLDDLYYRIDIAGYAASVTDKVPPFCTFNATGQDGTIVVDITNPQDAVYQSPKQRQYVQQFGDENGLYFPLVHQVQTCLTLKFDASGDVRTYGPNALTRVEISDTPNQTRYLRMRSSYDNGQTWNPWKILNDPILCGPKAVWSGLLRTVSLALLNSQAQTVDGTNALTQHLTTTRIDVAAKSWNVGGVKNLAYNGGSADPGVYGTFYVYGIDQKKQGGAITFLTTQNTGDLTAQDGIINFGKITTAGGGGGTGGGGGSCHVAGTMLRMFDGTDKDCSLILKEDELLGIDGGKEVAQADAEPVPNVPCFYLEFDNGVKLPNGVSSTEPIMLESGTFITVFEAMTGQRFTTRLGAAVLTVKTYIGNKLVWRQRLDRTKTFWADDLGSHNLKL